LGTIYPAPARLGSRVEIFLPEDLTIGIAKPDTDEHIAELRRLPLQEAVAMAARGDIIVGVSVAALMRAWHYVARSAQRTS